MRLFLNTSLVKYQKIFSIYHKVKLKSTKLNILKKV